MSQKKPPAIDVRRYAGRWVALDPVTSQVVADAPTVREARHEAIRRGTKRPLLMVVPKSEGFFAGTSAVGQAPA